jgi:diguanylate cyclase (GGDEF)-like protein
MMALMQQFSNRFKLQYAAFVLALAVIPFLLWLFQRTTEQLTHANGWLTHTYTVITQIDTLQHDLELAESARRAYAMVRSESYLMPYHRLNKTLPQTLAQLTALSKDNAFQSTRLRELEPLMDELIALIEQDIRKPRKDSQQQFIIMTRAKVLMDELRELFRQMRAEESRLLAARSAVSEQKMRNLQWLMGIVSASFVGLMLFSFMALYREILQRRRTELHLIESRTLAETTVRHLTLLGEMNNLLHPSQDAKEALQIVASFTERLVESRAGVIYLLNESKGRFEARTCWGQPPMSADNFHADDCWALRRCELHVLDHERHAVACPHLSRPEAVSVICAPILAQGERLGTIYLENPRERPFTEVEQRLLGQVALALANNRLRANLRSLSVRDPLTGLFNRRYMEESLMREIANAARKNKPLGLMILDLDYFKNINDNFGHEAGDQVLHQIARLLTRRSRTGDIACRFGGEEFVVIYLEADPEALTSFAMQLQTSIRELGLRHEGHDMGRITASFGLAVYPLHGQTADALLRVADQALYRAKADGRDRIEMAIAP